MHVFAKNLLGIFNYINRARIIFLINYLKRSMVKQGTTPVMYLLVLTKNYIKSI